MNKQIIATADAPAAIGTYSQATRHGNVVYLSGQIPLDPASMQLVEGDFSAQTHRVFKNLQAVCKAAGGSLDQVLRLTIFLTDMGNFPQVNAVMAEYFSQPYPARVTVGVVALPKGAQVEIDAILGL
ncbi:MAG TPA: RidA family protein [Xanthomonadales bacterium]|nr:RidA family protein [Xanthomonadales bacterium]